MITNDIQELLEGALGDEPMAELLHTLSVSPEKRAAFRQHIALHGTMQRDRAASALSAAEDAALWNAIATGAQVPAEIPSGGMALRVPSWLMRAAAVIVVGIGGYLLGSNQSTNVFGGVTSQSDVAGNATVVADAAQVPEAGVVAAAAGGQRTEGTDRTDRTGQNRQGSSTARYDHVSKRDGGSPSVLPSSEGQTEKPLSIDPTQLPDTKPIVLPLNNTRVDSPAATPIAQVPVPELKHGPDQSADLFETTTPALRTNGFELAFSERLGMITPAPTGINDPDPEFSNRSLDLSYRFGGGCFGAGLRATYGTFSSVHLEADQQSDIGVVTFVPKLEAKKGLAFEGFANYRLPIMRNVAVGFEGSYTAASTYSMFGGDVFLLWFVTDRIGVQAGGGIGQYMYNLKGQRDQLFKDHPNAGITSEASDSYKGILLQGRYGLFYRF